MLAAHAPYQLIGTVCVALAMAGHLVLRRAARGGGSRSVTSDD
jgi:hypothetical protein